MAMGSTLGMYFLFTHFCIFQMKIILFFHFFLTWNKKVRYRDEAPVSSLQVTVGKSPDLSACLPPSPPVPNTPSPHPHRHLVLISV